MPIQKKAVTLHPQSETNGLATKTLGYGVMVTLQILVLPFLVRVRVPQQKKSPRAFKVLGDFLCTYTLLYIGTRHVNEGFYEKENKRNLR